MRRLVRLFALLAVATACLPVAPAAALPFPVTSTADSLDPGTLRWAVEEANVNPGPDTIPIQVTGTIELKDQLSLISDSVAITGPGAGSLVVERASASRFRIFAFDSGITSSLSGLTVRGGAAELGGGIYNSKGDLTLTGVAVTGNEAREEGVAQTEALGGGIYSVGSLTLRESTVRDNVVLAVGGPTYATAMGGGVYAEGSLTVTRSTISENEALAEGQAEDVVAIGGGIQSLGEGTKIASSTISRNWAIAGEGDELEASGGGLEGNDIALTNSTVTANAVLSQGEALGANLGPIPASLVRNTIVSAPLGVVESCAKPLTSGGFNLDEDASCGFDKATDLEAVDPTLGPLTDNGGPTPTHAPLPGSAAIDRGFSFGATSDQRGLPRPSNFATVSDTEGGDGSDIGAVELQAPPPPSSPATQVSVVAGDRQAPNTRIVLGPPRSSFKRLAKFRFASSEAQSTFQCKLDKKRWRGCRNPYKRKVSAGRKHVFKVRAIDRFGNVDPTPARFGWRVKRVS
jgi:hypothetical protein